MEVSPARTLALPAAELAWQESEADYFSRSSGSLAKYDPDSSSWRTYQRLLFEEQNESLESFAAYGMTVDGVFYPLQMWERTTDGRDGGFWPTPDCSDRRSDKCRQQGLSNVVRKLYPTPTLADSKNVGSNGSHQDNLHKHFNGQLNPQFVEWLMGYPCEWTVLKDWVTPWCRPKRGKPLKD
jgi:hypothetical protein